MSSAFIPVFTKYVVRRGQPEAFALARSAFRLLSVLLILVTIGGILLSPWIVKLVAPGFVADKYSLTVTLTRLMFPYIFFVGLVALCMGILNIGTILGSLLAEGSVTYLYFADRLVQFPLGVFAIAAATAVLPSLSRQAAAEDFEALKDTFGHALKLVFFISIPSMLGLIVLREPIVALLFQRGEFDALETQLTAQALLYYSLGLWAFSAVRIVAATFFAMQDTRTPVKMAGLSILVNIVLGVALMKPLAHGGLALATW